MRILKVMIMVANATIIGLSIYGIGYVKGKTEQMNADKFDVDYAYKHGFEEGFEEAKDFYVFI